MTTGETTPLGWMIDGCDMREDWVRVVVGTRRRTCGTEGVRQDRRLEKTDIMAGFSSTRWRRLHDSCVRAEANWLTWWSKMLPLTVGEVVWDCASKPRVVPSGKETAPFLREQRRQQVRLTKEAAWRFLSRGVENHRPNCLLYVSHPESGWAPFWACLCAVTARFGDLQVSETHLWAHS